MFNGLHSTSTDFNNLPLDDENENCSNVPYNQLLHKCLMEKCGHEALLKDIYAWFERNTEKAKDPGAKGWQNSIRHNLSMNEVSLVD